MSSSSKRTASASLLLLALASFALASFLPGCTLFQNFGEPLACDDDGACPPELRCVDAKCAVVEPAAPRAPWLLPDRRWRARVSLAGAELGSPLAVEIPLPADVAARVALSSLVMTEPLGTLKSVHARIDGATLFLFTLGAPDGAYDVYFHDEGAVTAAGEPVNFVDDGVIGVYGLNNEALGFDSLRAHDPQAPARFIRSLRLLGGGIDAGTTVAGVILLGAERLTSRGGAVRFPYGTFDIVEHAAGADDLSLVETIVLARRNTVLAHLSIENNNTSAPLGPLRVYEIVDVDVEGDDEATLKGDSSNDLVMIFNETAACVARANAATDRAVGTIFDVGDAVNVGDIGGLPATATGDVGWATEHEMLTLAAGSVHGLVTFYGIGADHSAASDMIAAAAAAVVSVGALEDFAE